MTERAPNTPASTEGDDSNFDIEIVFKSGAKVYLVDMTKFEVDYSNRSGEAIGYTYRSAGGDMPFYVNVEEIAAVIRRGPQ